VSPSVLSIRAANQTAVTDYAAVRALYFIFVPLGISRNMPQVIDILGAELPTYLFFSVTSLIVFWWIELYELSTVLLLMCSYGCCPSYHNAANLQASFLGNDR
jgi:hypothetical protein